jgi:preprotein translocase subunit SecE
MANIKETQIFIEECWDELQKVTWPDWPQLRNATFVIIVFVLMISLVIWMMDVAVRRIIAMIMGMFGA